MVFRATTTLLNKLEEVTITDTNRDLIYSLTKTISEALSITSHCMYFIIFDENQELGISPEVCSGALLDCKNDVLNTIQKLNEISPNIETDRLLSASKKYEKYMDMLVADIEDKSILSDIELENMFTAREDDCTRFLTVQATPTNYKQSLKYHYKPKKGWINDPNGLVYFKGYYHIFYQHCPDFEEPWKQPMCWGHARTKDFLTFEELPIALFPEHEYENNGCWSGTATVKDDTLYLLYASVKGESKEQTVSMAYSTDGITFEKYEGNPVIADFPADGCRDFRDPAVCELDGKYYCVMASGNAEAREARLLLYRSLDLKSWEYCGIMSSWENKKYTECPSFMNAGDRFLLAASVVGYGEPHYFNIIYGSFKDGKFKTEYTAEIDRGPDQYAGQVFRDHLGRCILISWIPGWDYAGFAEKDIGCLSVPRELKCENGRITAYPVEEVRHLLTDSDPALKKTDTGFVIERQGRTPVVYDGEIRELKILRDGYIIEVFVNGGEEVFTALL